MVYTIDEIKKRVKPVAQEYGVDSVSLFGSYSKGEADEDSDLDFYIDKGDIKGLFDYLGFVQDLEEEFHCHVDVITTEIQDKEFLNSIKKESILIYKKDA